jgi:glycosyltransferase involved in cell wall biosynthesis
MPMYGLDSGVRLTHLKIKSSACLTKRIFSYFGLVKKIAKICNKDDVDIILGTSIPINIMLAFVKKEKLIRIAWGHSNYGYATFYTSAVRRITYPKLDAIVLLTPKDAENYSFCKNTKVIPNPMPFIPKKISALENKIIISAGRLHKDKGFDLLIEAVYSAKDKFGGWIFKIFGEGEERENLLKRIEEKDLSKIIEICPKTDNIEREYCNASIYVLPSREESFALVLAEAKSCGLPVVSFDCPNGPAYIVRDGIDGILVENGNTEALAQAALKLIENPQLRKQYGQEAVKDLDRFSPEVIFEKWDQLFKEIRRI